MLLGNRDGSEDRQGQAEERRKVWGAGEEARKLEGKGQTHPERKVKRFGLGYLAILELESMNRTGEEERGGGGEERPADHPGHAGGSRKNIHALNLGPKKGRGL